MLYSFDRLLITDWKQFESLDISFHPQITILTGANGSGKTTILNLLSRHFGWGFSELATPAKDKSTGLIRFFSRIFKSEYNAYNKIGELVYSSGVRANLIISDVSSAQYQIEIQGQQGISGLMIPSHRSVFTYQQVPHISTTKRTKAEAHSYANSVHLNRYFNHGMHYTSNYFIKETLLNWAIGGSGNEFIVADPELKKNFLDFEAILRVMLPHTLGFQRLSIRNYEIILETSSGDFMLDSVSGGVSAIIDLVWNIYTSSSDPSQGMTILIDEVENHLHPSMQRLILPSLLQAFPNVRFIVSTHSPLVIGSVQNSNVYAFRYVQVNQHQRVINERLDLVNKAKNASDILSEVLGVPFTMPVWVEAKLTDLVSRYSGYPIDSETFDRMRIELRGMGLEDLMPEVMKKTLLR